MRILPAAVVALAAFLRKILASTPPIPTF